MLTEAICKVQSQGSQILRMREIYVVQPQVDIEGPMITHTNPRVERIKNLESNIQGKRYACSGRDRPNVSLPPHHVGYGPSLLDGLCCPYSGQSSPLRSLTPMKVFSETPLHTPCLTSSFNQSADTQSQPSEPMGTP